MWLPAWPARFATRVARVARVARPVGAIVLPRLVWFAKRLAEGARLVAQIIIRLWAGRPGLDAAAPRWAIDTVRLAALAALLLYLEFSGASRPL